MDEVARYNKERWEDGAKNPDPVPGTWEHFKLNAPPGFSLWGRYRPDVLRAA